MSSDLARRVEELEIKVAFQDDTIDQLNRLVVEQQEELSKFKLQLSWLANKLKEAQTSNVASEAEETPPPHY